MSVAHFIHSFYDVEKLPYEIMVANNHINLTLEPGYTVDSNTEHYVECNFNALFITICVCALYGVNPPSDIWGEDCYAWLTPVLKRQIKNPYWYIANTQVETNDLPNLLLAFLNRQECTPEDLKNMISGRQGLWRELGVTYDITHQELVRLKYDKYMPYQMIWMHDSFEKFLTHVEEGWLNKIVDATPENLETLDMKYSRVIKITEKSTNENNEEIEITKYKILAQVEQENLTAPEIQAGASSQIDEVNPDSLKQIGEELGDSDEKPTTRQSSRRVSNLTPNMSELTTLLTPSRKTETVENKERRPNTKKKGKKKKK